jgi:hypothetical protein
MKKTSTKLFLAAAALGLAAASTVGSTYAWFTINGEATVSNLSMKVTSGAGIMFRNHSTTATDPFSVTMDLTDDAALKNVAFSPITLKTGEGADTDFTKFQEVNVASTITTKTAYVLTDVTSADGKYYTLDLDVRVSDGYNIGIKLKDVAVKNSAGTAVTTGLKASEVIRIGVVKYGAISSTTATKVGTYRAAAETPATDVATTQFNLAYSTTCPAYAPDSLDVLTTQITVAPSDTAADGYKTEHIKLVVWYEGTDFSCANDIFSQTVSFGIEFNPVAA